MSTATEFLARSIRIDCLVAIGNGDEDGSYVFAVALAHWGITEMALAGNFMFPPEEHR